MLNRKRYRYIRDSFDITFLFDIKESGHIKTIITDNITECDSLLDDIPVDARKFYENKIYELSHRPIIESIRYKLYNREEVLV